MNLFLVVNIPSDVQSQIVRATISLREQYPTMSWINPNHYKLVIGELGEIPEDRYDVVSNHIGMLLFDIKKTRVYPFDLHLSVDKEAELFIRLRENKVIKEIHDRIAIFTETRASRNQGKYIPSFIIARGRVAAKQQNTHLRNKLAKTPLDFEFDVTHVALYESISHGRHVEYKEKCTYQLVVDEE